MRYRSASWGWTQTVTGTAPEAACAFSLLENLASRLAFATIQSSASATSISRLAFSFAEIVPSLFFSSSRSSRRCLAAGNFNGLGGAGFFINLDLVQEMMGHYR